MTTVQLITRQAPLQTLTVFGNYGSLEVCKRSGRVLSYDPDRDDPDDPDHAAYHDIVKFDLKELVDHYGEDEVARPQNWDILDVGFWFATERGTVTYCEPEQDWREEIIDPEFGWKRLPRVIHLGGPSA